MPNKIGKPLEKTEAQKKADKELIEEIEKDATNPPEEFDPLESQAEALPEGIKGSESGKEHVLPADGGSAASEGGHIPDEDEEFDEDDDPGKLTA